MLAGEESEWVWPGTNMVVEVDEIVERPGRWSVLIIVKMS